MLEELSGQFEKHIREVEKIESQVVQEQMTNSPKRAKLEKLSQNFEQLVKNFVQAKESPCATSS